MATQSNANYSPIVPAAGGGSTSSNSDVERIEKLQKIEQEIGYLLGHAADAINELSNPYPSSDVVSDKTKSFLKSLETVEQGLSDQISYLSRVSTMHSHEGSNYGAEKDYELLTLQTALAKERLQKLLT